MKLKDISIYILAFFISVLPLLYTEKTLDPVLTLRFFFLAIVVLILVVCGGLSVLKEKVLKHPVIITLIALFVCYSVSTIFSTYIISEGIYHSLKAGVMLLLLLSMMPLVSEDKSLLLKAGVLFALITGILTIFQYTTALLDGSLLSEVNKIAGTMANKNLLASVLFLGLPFCLYALFCLKSKFWKVLGVLSIVLSLIIFFIVQSKAVIIALVIGLFSFMFLNTKSVKQFSIATAVIGVFVLSVFFGLGQLGLRDNLVSEFDKLSNINEQLSNKNRSTGARYFLYKNTVEIIKNNPVLGVGPGNWKIEIPKAGLYLTKGERGNNIVQRPHSDFLWVMAEGGILAGLLYIFLFLLVLRDSYRLAKEADGKERMFYSAIFATIMGYMFISSVDFPMERVAHNVLFYLLIAVVVSARLKNTKNNTFNYQKPIRIACVLVALCASFVGYARHQGEIHATAAKLYKGKSHWQRIIKEVDKAYKPGIYEIDRSSTPLHWYSGVAKFSLGKQDAAFKDFKQAYELNPNHLHVLNNIATCYELKGDRSKAIKYYNKALAISPRFEEASVNLSAVLYNEKQYEEALDILLRCNIAKDKEKYDRYLSAIVKAYVNLEFKTVEEQKIAFSFIQLSKDHPWRYLQYLKNAYETRQTEKKSYKELLIKQLPS
jgi:O-antigen ligase/Tfp pilus assembly protein PilF